MKNVMFIALMLSLMLGCWKQHDEITIKGDGNISFQSEVIITDSGFSLHDIDELSNEFMKGLKHSGWMVERSWTSKAKPFRLAFKGTSNIHNITSYSDFYTIKKVDARSYQMRFYPAMSKGGRSTRSIAFPSPFMGGAKIFDSKGLRVKEIPNVLGSLPYLVVLS